MDASKDIQLAAAQGLTHNPEATPDLYSSQVTYTNQIMLDVKCWVQDVIGTCKTLQDGAEPFVFCDYGCSDGGKSVPVINEVIAQVRNLMTPDRDILIIYEDQPENNFSAVFQKRQDRLTGDVKVFPLACGLGFYKQCLPSNFVNLGMCSFGAHWLSYKPCGLRQAVIVNDGGTETELAQFAKVSGEDWGVFLLHRARELKPGGFIRVIVVVCIEGQARNATPRSVSNPREGVVFFEMMGTVKKEMFQEGIVTEEEMLDMCFGAYFRSEYEVRVPFNDPDSPVRRAGLVLHAIHKKNFDCALHTKYRRDLKEKGSEIAGMEHAKALRQSIEGPGFQTFLAAISHDRPQSEREELADTFFDRIEQKVLDEPDQYGIGFTTLHVDIHKV